VTGTAAHPWERWRLAGVFLELYSHSQLASESLALPGKRPAFGIFNHTPHAHEYLMRNRVVLDRQTD